jgi:hypothetical protein
MRMNQQITDTELLYEPDSTPCEIFQFSMKHNQQ